MDGLTRPKSIRSHPAARHVPHGLSTTEARLVEQIQRCRIWLDTGAAALELAERRLGPFHETTSRIRAALDDVRRAWARLRASAGTVALDSMLADRPRALVHLEAGAAAPGLGLLVIAGHTYRAERVAGTRLAPVQWRLVRLAGEPRDEPFFVVRLSDGSTQCDCADWTFEVNQTDRIEPCKHIAALRSLDWM